ncbi:MAG: response regulator transcription factor [Sutterellaceae bacterium]|nr:response regulator transcription factor [Sutterellaceae bacterium]MDD7441438.1 response regulator transcription factor [Sutterellaceae bacterium]MDY2868252.1 response regulator transcription factor [Mesosutterella sp.]
MKVWCVEDDASIREIEVYALRSSGFEAKGLENAAEFWAALSSEIPDLVVLDIMLPGDMDGTAILKRLRSAAEWKSIPVIMASAKGQEYEKVKLLDLGADDYIVKPFGVMELVSRIRAVLRRSSPGPEKAEGRVLRVSGIVLSTAERTVTVGGKRVELALKEFELLRTFMTRPGIVFTRSQLFANVWGEEFESESRTVDMHIRNLRQKLGKYGVLIQTVRGVGYKMEKKS